MGAGLCFQKREARNPGAVAPKNADSFWQQGHNVGLLSSTTKEFVKKGEQWAKERATGWRNPEMKRESSSVCAGWLSL